MFSHNDAFYSLGKLKKTNKSIRENENNKSFLQTVLEKRQRRKKRRDCVSYLVCQCSACMNARLPRTDHSVVLIYTLRFSSSSSSFCGMISSFRCSCITRFTSNNRTNSCCCCFFVLKTNETSKPTPPISTRRPAEANGEIFRYDVPNETSNRNTRWPVISRAHRLTPADEKQRRSQVFINYTRVFSRSYRFIVYIQYY